MITAAELFVMANISCDDEILTERLSILCDALEWGFQSVHDLGDASPDWITIWTVPLYCRYCRLQTA